MGILSATDGDEGENAMISFLINDDNGSKCPCFKWFVTNESERNNCFARVSGEGGRNLARTGNLGDYFKHSSDIFSERDGIIVRNRN